MTMTEGSYNQFCPVAMAAEILCTRWTLIVLRELMAGSTRFNELRRGVPSMSPALLSKRLKDLEAAKIIARTPVTGEPGVFAYTLTPSGKELEPVVMAVGAWGHKWISRETSLGKLDVNLLMWDMRRNIDAKPMPLHRSTIQFIYSDLDEPKKHWWLIAEPGKEIDLCSVDPGFDVDLYLLTDLKTMTEVWMGHIDIATAVAKRKLEITGDRQLESSLKSWFRLSVFARVQRTAA
jgi:DNA-binding HxlR family transcriptional regulator